MQILKLFLFFVQDKCFHYWPEVGTNCHGCMQVTLTESSFLPVYSMRTFSLIHEQVFKKSSHFYIIFTPLYDAKPDFPNNFIRQKNGGDESEESYAQRIIQSDKSFARS